MSSTTEIISTTAAVFALIIAALSALAAFRSADSARSAQRSADEVARRLQLFNVSRTATDALLELQRVLSRAEQALIAYDTLGVFSGSYKNSGNEECKAKVQARVQRARDIAEYATLFVDSGSKLEQAPSDEIDRVQLKVSASHREITAIREELDRDVASTEAQNAQYRDRALSR